MKLLYHPDRKDISPPGVLPALGDPTRLEMVKGLVAKGEQTCSTLEVLIAKSTLSHHFRVLWESGVLYSGKEGTQNINLCVARI